MTETAKKTFDTATLKSLCDTAIRLKFDHGPDAEFWDHVHPDGEHVVTFWMRHSPCLQFWGTAVDHPDFPWDFSHNGGVNIRACVSCEMKNGRRVDLLCDFDQEEFEKVTR